MLLSISLFSPEIGVSPELLPKSTLAKTMCEVSKCWFSWADYISMFLAPTTIVSNLLISCLDVLKPTLGHQREDRTFLILIIDCTWLNLPAKLLVSRSETRSHSAADHISKIRTRSLPDFKWMCYLTKQFPRVHVSVSRYCALQKHGLSVELTNVFENGNIINAHRTIGSQK